MVSVISNGREAKNIKTHRRILNAFQMELFLLARAEKGSVCLSFAALGMDPKAFILSYNPAS